LSCWFTKKTWEFQEPKKFPRDVSGDNVCVQEVNVKWTGKASGKAFVYLQFTHCYYFWSYKLKL